MAFADPRRTQTVAHRYVFRVASIEGSSVKVLWEGDSMGEGEKQAEAFAVKAREAGSAETITMDCFRLEVEKLWVQRTFTSRPPSSLPIHRPGKKGRRKILFLPLEFATWMGAGASWSYAASLAYVAGLERAGCDVTVINTPCVPYHRKIIRERRFDEVWFHLHPKHLDDFAFREWVADIAPVRLMLCGETIHYDELEAETMPWSANHTSTFKKWEPFVTHAAFVDAADMKKSALKNVCAWRQAVPVGFVKDVNRRPRRETASFLGTAYPPRDRWLFELRGLVERVESPESMAFGALFEKSHEWMQSVFDKAGLERNQWWASGAFKAYNRLQRALRKHSLGNAISAMSEGLATVNLPSMVKGYSGRVFEAMAAGRPVLTRKVNDPVFEEDREILHFDSIAELAEKIRFLQKDPAAAVAIATAARAELLEKHTVEVRTKELLSFTAAGVSEG